MDNKDSIDREYEVVLRAFDGEREQERERRWHTMSHIHIHAMWAEWDHYYYSHSIGSPSSGQWRFRGHDIL